MLDLNLAKKIVRRSGAKGKTTKVPTMRISGSSVYIMVFSGNYPMSRAYDSLQKEGFNVSPKA
jgi:hypothetical protein